MSVKIGGTRAAFANTVPELVYAIRGHEAGDGRGAKVAQYHAAIQRNMSVLAIVFELLGGFSPEALKEFRYMARQKGEKLSADEETQTSWAARNYTAFHAQRISIAIQTYAAKEVLDAARLARAADYGNTSGSYEDEPSLEAVHGMGEEEDMRDTRDMSEDDAAPGGDAVGANAGGYGSEW